MLKEISVKGATSATDIDFEKKLIPLITLKSDQTASSSAKATGKKTTGTPAKGPISLRNYNTITDKSFAKGTILKATGSLESLKYTLDQAVTIPHASTSSRIDTSGKKINETDPGRKDAEVTAVEIGQNYNAEAGQVFVVGTEGFENVNAITLTGLSGGTSREITILSETDSRSLEEKVV